MEKKSKVETFIGFSVKARVLVTGSDAVDRLKKAYLILICASASENTAKLASVCAKRLNCPLMTCKIPLQDLCNKSNCKIAAVTDKNLATAIIDNRDENFSVCLGGGR